MPNDNSTVVSFRYLPLVVFLVLQLAAGTWWAASITAKQDYIIEQISEVKDVFKQHLDDCANMKRSHAVLNREVAVNTSKISSMLERLRNVR